MHIKKPRCAQVIHTLLCIAMRHEVGNVHSRCLLFHSRLQFPVQIQLSFGSLAFAMNGKVRRTRILRRQSSSAKIQTLSSHDPVNLGGLLYRLAADPVLAAHLGRLRPGLLLPQNADDLLFRELACLHVHPPAGDGLTHFWRRFRGSGQFPNRPSSDSYVANDGGSP